MATISGIDVSQWQGTINWAKVKEAGIQFALLRAGYGDCLSYPNQIDWQWEANYKNCKSVGMPVGAYYYSYATTVDAAKREAQSCLSLLKGKQFEYPIYYDVEEMSIFRTGRTNEIIKAFADVLEQAGYYVGIYIYRSAAQSYLNETTKNKYSMAIAEYNTQCYYTGKYDIWQNSSTTRVNGINGNVDHDYCYVDFPAKIKAGGFNGYTKSAQPNPTPKPTPTPAPKPAAKPTPSKKSVDEIAKEVIAGKWSAGDDRRKKLTAAGYDYQIIQNRVNQMLGIKVTAPAKKSINQIALEVIRGNWGAGEDRRRRLTAAGYDYNAVQNLVNQMMK